MLNWFEDTRKRLRTLARKAYRDERRRLPSVLAKVADKASQEGPDTSSHSLTDLLKRSMGSRDPGFARGLNSLAILAMARGEFEEAESLFVRALTIRKGMLGSFHPETIDTKERLDALRQLMNSSQEAPFTVAEPSKSISASETTIDVFEVLEQRAGDESNAVAPGAEPVLEAETFDSASAEGLSDEEPAPAATRTARVEPTQARAVPSAPLPIVKIHPSGGFQPVPVAGRVTEGIAEEIAELSETFKRLAAKMSEAAARLKATGELPADEVVEEIEEAQREFQKRRSRLRQSASDLRFSPRSDHELASLDDLSSWLEAMVETERHGVETRLIRAKAIESISRFLSLAHLNDPDFAPLKQYQTNAAALRETIARDRSPETLEEAKSLAEGHHPISDVLILVNRRKVLDDAEWSELYASVEKHLGGELAAAAARGRLKSLPVSHPKFQGGNALFNFPTTSTAS